MNPRIANWFNIRPVVKIGKLNRYLTLPAFSQACFRTKRSLHITQLQTTPIPCTSINRSDLSSAFTFECWLKNTLPKFNIFQTVYTMARNVEADIQWSIYTYNNKVAVATLKTGVLTPFVSTSEAPIGQWYHLAVTYDGTTVKIYINGVLDATTQTVAAPLDQATGNIYGMFIGSKPYVLDEMFTGYVAEIRIWTDALDNETILYKMSHPRNIVAADSVDDTLAYYFSVSDILTVGTTTQINNDLDDTVYFSINNTKTLLETEDVPPINFGASFIPIKYEVVADKVHSLKVPIVAPVSRNFGLYVSWTDSNGVFQRRRLLASTSGVIDINPVPVDYVGEKLPVSYNLEIWNIDGEETVDLATAITIETSIKDNPAYSYSRTPAVGGTLTADNTLAENFPLTSFPLTFNTAQTY